MVFFDVLVVAVLIDLGLNLLHAVVDVVARCVTFFWLGDNRVKQRTNIPNDDLLWGLDIHTTNLLRGTDIQTLLFLLLYTRQNSPIQYRFYRSSNN